MNNKKWYNVNLNSNQIVYESDKATLIRMPNSSEYAGYTFWHPNKLIRGGKGSFCCEMGYSEDFKFKLQKHSTSRNTGYKLLDECEIDAEEFSSIFHISLQNSSRRKNELHVPETILPVENNIIEELIDE